MFNKYVNVSQNITLPDRLLTEIYKDGRQLEQRRIDTIREYTNDADVEKLRELLYKHPNETYIFGGRIFKKADIEAYIDYRTKEWL